MSVQSTCTATPEAIANDLRDSVRELRLLQREHGPECKGHPVTMGHMLALRIADLLAEAIRDSERLNFLESRAQEDGRVEIGFTDAWTEPGDYGSILSSGPLEYWLRDDGSESGPTLREAIDSARALSPGDAAE
jgi:hypothetical protein